jgi:positive regulator of sigma E activity
MASEALTVIDTDSEMLQVNTRRQSWCNNCDARSGCGMQLLQAASFSKQEILSFPMPATLRGKVVRGDVVDFKVQDQQIMQLAFLHYLLPLICMLAATLLGTALSDVLNAGEIPVILAAFSGLLLSLFLVRQLSKKYVEFPAGILLLSKS